MRSGQMWSVDFTLSIFLFTAAMVISFSIITNTIDDRGYDEVERQAVMAVDILASEGYPAHWNSTNVIRAGLLGGGKISLRKALEMNDLTLEDLRKSLRITDNIYVYITNSSDDTVAVFTECGVGDTSVPTGAEKLAIPSMAIVGENDLINRLENITVFTDDSAYGVLVKQDVVVLEGSFGSASAMTPAQIENRMSAVAETGMTFIVVGNVTTPTHGAAFTTTDETTTIQLLGDAGVAFGFATDELLTLPTTMNITIPTFDGDPHVENFHVIAETEGGFPAYAKWTYKDAQIYYFSEIEGLRGNGDDLLDFMVNVTQDMIVVDRPLCGELSLNPLWKHIAHKERVVGYHDMPLTVRVVVWRT